jgi:hypothetical protein
VVCMHLETAGFSHECLFQIIRLFYMQRIGRTQLNTSIHDFVGYQGFSHFLIGILPCLIVTLVKPTKYQQRENESMVVR